LIIIVSTPVCVAVVSATDNNVDVRTNAATHDVVVDRHTVVVSSLFDGFKVVNTEGKFHRYGGGFISSKDDATAGRATSDGVATVADHWFVTGETELYSRHDSTSI